jgi:hypothetical protein
VNYGTASARTGPRRTENRHDNFFKVALSEGEAYEANLALGIEGETSDRNLLHLVE